MGKPSEKQRLVDEKLKAERRKALYLPARGTMRWSVEKKINLGFGLALLILIVIGIVSYRSTNKLVESAGEVAHTNRVLTELEDISSHLKDAHRRTRSYILTERENYLELFQVSVNEINQELKNLHRLIEPNSDQQRRLIILEALIEKDITSLKEIIELKKNQGFGAAVEAIGIVEEEKFIDDIRNLINEMKLEGIELLKQRDKRVKARARNTNYTIIGGSVMALFLVVASIFIIKRDITERKRAEEALQKAHDELEVRVQERTAELAEINKELASERERLAVTLRSINDGVILIDADNLIVLANPTGRQYLRLLADVGIGDVLTHLGEQPFDKLLEPPPEGMVYHEVILEGVSQRIFEVTPQPMESESQISGWVLVIRDVTKERAIRQRIETQERLAAVGQLAAGIAHDFNNSLAVILGLSELLKKEQTLSEEVGSLVNIIIRQGHQASTLVQQILDFSRQSIPKQHPLDLLSFLKESVKLLERIIPENIRIILDFTSGEFWIEADPSQMQQILTNLIVNARDAMPKGGEIMVGLTTSNFDYTTQPPFPDMLSNEWLILSVSDTGIGIEPKNIPRIFEPFFTTKARSTGTGLGLAQVYGLVKQHNGFIDVTSEVGKGTTFTIYLPLMTERKADQIKADNEDVIYGHGEVILLAEDDPLVLETNKAMLESLGYQVLTAKDGQEALSIYHQHHKKISLILTDALMPDMDGLALLEKLTTYGPDIKAVLMTGYSLEEETKDILTQRAINWIQKPFTIVNLSQVVSLSLNSELSGTLEERFRSIYMLTRH